MKIIGIIIAIILIIISTIVLEINKENVASGVDDFICIFAIIMSILFIITRFL